VDELGVAAVRRMIADLPRMIADRDVQLIADQATRRQA